MTDGEIAKFKDSFLKYMRHMLDTVSPQELTKLREAYDIVEAWTPDDGRYN